MEARIFLMADFANTDSAGKLNLLGAFDTINSPTFPFVHPLMFIVVKLSAELGEFGTSRVFKIALYDEDMTEVGSAEGSFSVPQPTGGKKSQVNLIIGLRDLQFNKPGRFEWRLLINDDLKGDIALDVNQIEVNHAD